MSVERREFLKSLSTGTLALSCGMFAGILDNVHTRQEKRKERRHERQQDRQSRRDRAYEERQQEEG